MKPIKPIRRSMSISQDIVDLLNQQIKIEAKASSVYLSIASWCDQRGLVRAATFFYEQSQEERDHMLKIFHFINDAGGQAISPEISGVSPEFDTLKEVFEYSLDREIEVTKSIYKIIQHCRELMDYGTENFLNWFITEQLEEEATMRSIIDMIDLMEGQPLQLIDERIIITSQEVDQAASAE